VGDDGTMLACSHGGFTGGAPPVWSSLDGGRSWSASSVPDGDLTGDCDVLVASGGAWLMAYTAVRAAQGYLLGFELRFARAASTAAARGASTRCPPTRCRTASGSRRAAPR
jgi:hypothetical protein